MNANAPVGPNGRTYHLQVREGDLSPLCLLVGNPDRATLISNSFFTSATKVGDHRGLRSYTGDYNNIPMSVVTTGMGSGTTGIVMPEAYVGGGRRFIRVGSCGAIREEAKVGQIAVCTGAVRLDGASENWAPIEYPAVADFRVTAALVEAAKKRGIAYHTGIGATTTCFVEGQARPDLNGYIPPRLQAQHEELIQRDVLFYSMEEATIFVWCTTHGKDIWAGAVDAIFANRIDGSFETQGEVDAAQVAIDALESLVMNYPI